MGGLGRKRNPFLDRGQYFGIIKVELFHFVETVHIFVVTEASFCRAILIQCALERPVSDAPKGGLNLFFQHFEVNISTLNIFIENLLR